MISFLIYRFNQVIAGSQDAGLALVLTFNLPVMHGINIAWSFYIKLFALASLLPTAWAEFIF